jgi:hypothetical protein
MSNTQGILDSIIDAKAIAKEFNEVSDAINGIYASLDNSKAAFKQFTNDAINLLKEVKKATAIFKS